MPLKTDWGWKLRRDGDHWRATGPGFVDTQTSPVGYGATPEIAVAHLARARPDVPAVTMFKIFPPVSLIELEGGLMVEEPDDPWPDGIK
jgi:hypothetical protein